MKPNVLNGYVRDPGVGAFIFAFYVLAQRIAKEILSFSEIYLSFEGLLMLVLVGILGGTAGAALYKFVILPCFEGKKALDIIIITVVILGIVVGWII